MLRALRISRASETAIKACRLFRCPDCPRLGEPKQPRPSKLPMVDEFNVQIGLDIFSEKDAKGHTYTWLNVFDQGTFVSGLQSSWADPCQPNFGRSASCFYHLVDRLGGFPGAGEARALKPSLGFRALGVDRA